MSCKNVRYLPPAAKYLKKLKDKNLKSLYLSAIEAISENPELGEEKEHDLNTRATIYPIGSAIFLILRSALLRSPRRYLLLKPVLLRL